MAKRSSGGGGRSVIVGPHHEGGWQVKKAGGERASNVFDRKQEAVDRGRELAKKERSELIVQRGDGRITQKDSEGHDPRRTKG